MEYSSRITRSPPSGKILSLLTALSNPTNHEMHMAALTARDAALSASVDSYSVVCLDLARVLATVSPSLIPHTELEIWSANVGGIGVLQLQNDPEGGWLQVREIAGLLLKNALIQPPWENNINCNDESPSPMTTVMTTNQPHLRRRMRLLSDVALEIKHILIQCVVDMNVNVRRVSSSIISACTLMPLGSVSSSSERTVVLADEIPSLPLRDWPELPPFLCSCLEHGMQLYTEPLQMSFNTDGSIRLEHHSVQCALLGVLQTITKMMEDAPVKFEHECGSISFQRIVTALLTLLQSPRVQEKHDVQNIHLIQPLKDVERVKVFALECCIYLIGTMPSSLVVAMDHLFAVLSSLCFDNGFQVRKLVCKAIVVLLQSRAEYISPHISSISSFMLHATSDSNHEVALEACEFWLTFASLDTDVCSPEMTESIRCLLDRLVPVLVKAMIYPAEKIEELIEMNKVDEALGEDHVQDIAPVFYKSKMKGGQVSGAGKGASKEEEDDDDDDDNNYDEREWSLRTCSAAALDALATVYANEDILTHLLPVLNQSLSHSDPWVREAGILALGAVSSGCYQQMSSHMLHLHPFLMDQLTTASLPQIKSICLWTLSRYVSWAAGQVASGQVPELMGKLTEAFLNCVPSNNRKVQLASCSAISDIVERTPELMEPFVDPILSVFSQALLRYQTRSLLVLLDAIGNIADFVGCALAESRSLHACLSSMLFLWRNRTKQNPNDPILLSLMESLASIAINVGTNFQPFALDCFDNAMATIENCSILLATSEYGNDEADPIVCATDLLDGLVEGLESSFSSLVMSSTRYGPHFLNVMHSLLGHDVSSVRMSAFALLGDLARQCPALLDESIQVLLEEAVANVDPSYPQVCNNAVWAIGEVCVKCKGNPSLLQPFAADIVQNLIVLLMGNPYVEDEYGMPVSGLTENAASTMGRLAMVHPSFVARDLPRCLSGWCDGMSKISDVNERRDAFEGFICAVRTYPDSIMESSANVTETITSILFAVVSLHLPEGTIPSASLLKGPYKFVNAPAHYLDLVGDLSILLQQVRNLVGPDLWVQVKKDIPSNVKKLLLEVYNIN